MACDDLAANFAKLQNYKNTILRGIANQPIPEQQSARDGDQKHLTALSNQIEDDLLTVDLLECGTDCSGEPLFAVCPHGTHDLCCAKCGNAVYASLDSYARGCAWKISHSWGCRFAPNVLSLRHGYVYGWVN